MIQLELTTDEAKYLKEEVATRLTELEHEIDHTDSLEFKEKLKHRRESFRTFLEKLPESAAIAT